MARTSTKPLAFFRHDANSAEDRKIKFLLKRHGMEGYGRWWRLCEILASEQDQQLEMQTEEDEKKGWTKKGDERITRFGSFMRRTSIDEVPQFINVLKGDMSLVGPRPERPQFVEKFRETIPRYMIKHQVRPGMTGWAQINGYRGDTSIRKRIEHDLYYIENWRLTLDIRILILTVFKGFSTLCTTTTRVVVFSLRNTRCRQILICRCCNLLIVSMRMNYSTTKCALELTNVQFFLTCEFNVTC